MTLISGTALAPEGASGGQRTSANTLAGLLLLGVQGRRLPNRDPPTVPREPTRAAQNLSFWAKRPCQGSDFQLARPKQLPYQ